MSLSPATAQLGVSSSLKRLINHHPLGAYFLLAYTGAWIAVFPLLLGRNGFGVFPFVLPSLPFTALATLTGPLLAAITITAINQGKAAVWQLLRRCIEWRVGFHWYLLTFFGFPALYVIATCLVRGVTFLSILIEQWQMFFTVYLPAVAAFSLLGTIGEEVGWSGFALPRLQQRYGPLLGACLLGTFWAVWHLPGYFGGWLGPFTLAGFVVFVLVSVVMRIIWTWVYNNTRGSILLPILLHAVSTAAGVWFLKLMPTFPPSISLIGYLLLLACALLILLFTRGRLSYKPEPRGQRVETSSTVPGEQD